MSRYRLKIHTKGSHVIKNCLISLRNMMTNYSKFEEVSHENEHLILQVHDGHKNKEIHKHTRKNSLSKMASLIFMMFVTFTFFLVELITGKTFTFLRIATKFLFDLSLLDVSILRTHN